MLKKVRIGMLAISVLATAHINCMNAETPQAPQKTTVVIHPENEELCDGTITLMLYQKGESDDEYTSSYIAPEDFNKYRIITGKQEIDDNNQRNKIETQKFLQALSQLGVTPKISQSIQTTSQNYNFYIHPAIDIQPLLQYLKHIEDNKTERENNPIKTRPVSSSSTPTQSTKTYNFTFKQIVFGSSATIGITALATTVLITLLRR